MSSAAVDVDRVKVSEAFWNGTEDVAEPAAGWCVWWAKGVGGDAARFAAVRAAHPGKRFVLFGTLPAGGADADAFSAKNVKLRAANAELKKLADGKDIVFLDASARFLRRDGSTDPSLVTVGGQLTDKAREYLVRQFEWAMAGVQLTISPDQRWRNLPDDDVPTLLYVATGGDDAAAGTKATPLRTLAGARNRIRQLKAAAGGMIPGGVIVTFAEGEYLFDGPVAFGPEDGGTCECPVVYRAERPLAARFSGAQRPRWALNEKMGFYEATIAGTDPLPGFYGSGCCSRLARLQIEHPVQLYQDGERMTCARWPNKGEEGQVWECYADATDLGTDTTWQERFKDGMITVADRNGRIKDLAALAKDKDVWTFGLWYMEYADATAPVTEWDVKRNAFRLDDRMIGYGWRRHAEMHFFNALSELDEPGEWVIDRSARKLYAKPLPGKAEMPVVSVVPTLVTARGVGYVTFDGFVFEYSRDTALMFDGCRNVTVRTSVIRHTSADAVRIDGGSDCRVEGCDLYDLGKGGIWMNGGSLYTLSPCNHTVDNCHIRDYGQVTYNYQPGISLNGTGCRVTHNLIHHTRHQAVQFKGNLHYVGFNVMHDLCMHNGDAGAIYAYNTTGAWNMRGNVIEYNLVHMVGDQPRAFMCEGIYLDAFVSGTVVRGNLVNRSTIGIFSSGGQDNLIEKNVLMRNYQSIRKWNLGSGHHPGSQLGADSYLYHPLARHREIFEMGFWKDRFPNMLKPLDMPDPSFAHCSHFATIRTNALVATSRILLIDKGSTYDDSETGGTCTVDGNLSYDGDPGFVDYLGGNWELRDDSPLRKALGGGTRFGEMGLYDSPLRASPAVKYGAGMTPIRKLKRECTAAEAWLEIYWQDDLPAGVAECCTDRSQCEYLPWGEKGKVIWGKFGRVPHDEWRTYSFAFTPTADGILDFQLGGAWGEKTRYDDFRLTGATLENGDFSTAKGWERVPLIPDAISYADVTEPWGLVDGSAACNEKARLSQKVRVKKGVRVTCSFRAMGFDDPSQDY